MISWAWCVQVEGQAQFAKAAVACPWLKYPVTNLGGTVRMSKNALQARLLFLSLQGLYAS